MIRDVVFRETKLKRLLALGTGLEKARVKVGILEGKGGEAEHGESGMAIIEIAAVHEFGSVDGRIPERSFLRRTFEEQQDELIKFQSKIAVAVVNQRLSIEQGLGQLGLWAQAAIKRTITGDPPIPPPLKPATIARKGSDRPLVDTGQLLNSIQWELEL